MLPKLNFFEHTKPLVPFNMVCDDKESEQHFPLIPNLGTEVDVPPAWQDDARIGRLLPNAAVLRFVFTQADLAGMFEEVAATGERAERCSLPQIFNGFPFLLTLDLDIHGNLGIKLCRGGLAPVIPEPDVVHIKGTIKLVTEEGRRRTTVVQPFRLWLSTGWGDELGTYESLEGAEPIIMKGKVIVFDCELSDVK